MQLFRSSEHVALGFGPERLRLAVGKANGSLAVRHADAEPLPADALRAGLRAPTLEDPDAVRTALGALVERARAAGRLRKAPDLVAVVLSDGAVKMATAPIEGGVPDRAEGERMARWVLRELLPGEPHEVRVDWSASAADDGSGGLLGLGAAEAVVAEYEGLVTELGWHPGRVVPWTFAAAAALGEDVERTLVLCEGDGALAGVFEDRGQLLFHRAWRARVDAERLASELSALERYVADHLSTTIARVVVCGRAEWRTVASAAAARAGLAVAELEPEAALAGALGQ